MALCSTYDNFNHCLILAVICLICVPFYKGKYHVCMFQHCIPSIKHNALQKQDSIMFGGLEKKKNEILIDLMHIVLICCSPNCSFLFVCLYFRNFFFFFRPKHVRSYFPNQGLNPYPPPTWELRLLTTGPQGKSPKLFLWLNFISLSIFYLFQVKSLLYTSL